MARSINKTIILPMARDPRQILRLAIYVIMLCYPISIFIVKGLREEYLALLVLLALIAFVIDKCRYKDISLNRLDVCFLSSLFLMFFVTFVSWAYFGFMKSGESIVGKYSYFMLAIPVFFLLRYTRPRMEIIWIGVVIGCYVAFGRALLEEYDLVEEFRDRDFTRANGTMNPIRFGGLSLSMGFIALAGSLYFTTYHRLLRLLGLFAFFAGLGASILSQSRGAWIGIPILLLIVLWPFLKAQSNKIRLLTLGVIVATLLLVMTLVGDKVTHRYEAAVNDVQEFTEKNNKKTSIGVRFFMMNAAWNIFTNNPTFGVGAGNYRAHAVAYFKEQNPNIGGKFLKWRNPHNEYLLHAASRGVIGLSALLFTFVIGFYYFFRVKKTSSDCDFQAISGMLVICAYAQFGLTIALFEHLDFLVFFVIYLTIFLQRLTLPGKYKI